MAKQAKTKPAKTTEAESPRQKFERILTARMNRVLNGIRLLGNLSSAAYDWDLEEIQLVRTAIADQLNSSMSRFEKRKPLKVDFKLPERVEDL